MYESNRADQYKATCVSSMLYDRSSDSILAMPWRIKKAFKLIIKEIKQIKQSSFHWQPCFSYHLSVDANMFSKSTSTNERDE